MQGTPKQVEWATTIRKAMMAAIEPELLRWAKRFDGKPAELDKLQALRDSLATKPAAWWIDRRDVFALDLMRQVVGELVAAPIHEVQQ